MAALAPLRLIASVEAGTTSGAQLETLLADAGRLAEFRVLLDDRGQVRRMASANVASARSSCADRPLAPYGADSLAMAACVMLRISWRSTTVNSSRIAAASASV